jgi:hypothetical protein
MMKAAKLLPYAVDLGRQLSKMLIETRPASKENE